MFDNLCKSWPRGSQQCINRLKNKQTSYRVLNTVLIKVLYERCGSWPQKCYGDGYSTGWLRHFIATRRHEFFNFRSAEARSDMTNSLRKKSYSENTEFNCWLVVIFFPYDDPLSVQETTIANRGNIFGNYFSLYLSICRLTTVLYVALAFAKLTETFVHKKTKTLRPSKRRTLHWMVCFLMAFVFDRRS